MARDIKLKMRDGTVREFKHQTRAGGSYTKAISYEPGFVVIEDEYGNKTAIPSDKIDEVVVTEHGRF